LCARARRQRVGPRLRSAAPALCLAACAFFFAAPSARARQAEQLSAARVARAVEEARRSPLPDEAVARLLALGYQLVSGKRFAEAADLFGALAEQRPNDSSALYGAALANLNLSRTVPAERFARLAVNAALAAVGQSALTPEALRERRARAADALVLLAVVVAFRSADAEALKAARQAAQLSPEHFDAQFTLGRALYGASDFAGAARAFRAAVRLRPADPRALFFLATALERSGEADAALAAYRDLSARRPDASEGHLGLGVLLVKRGGEGVEEGLKALARALEINPDLYEARVTLGRALVARGRAAEAVEHLKRAAALAPDNPEPHYQLSLAYRRLGRAQEAAAESAIVKRIHESRRATAP